MLVRNRDRLKDLLAREPADSPRAQDAADRLTEVEDQLFLLGEDAVHQEAAAANRTVQETLIATEAGEWLPRFLRAAYVAARLRVVFDSAGRTITVSSGDRAAVLELVD